MAKRDSSGRGVVAHAIIAATLIIFGTVLMMVGCQTRAPYVSEPAPETSEEVEVPEIAEETAEEPETAEVSENPEEQEEPIVLLHLCHACDKAKEARTHEIFVDGEYACSLCDDCLYLLTKVVGNESVL